MRGCRSFRGGRMLLAAPIAASVLVSCAEPPHVGALDVPTKTLSVQAEIDQLHERIMGSAADRSAGEFLTYMKVQGTLRTCMAETGFVYSPPLFVDPYANRAVPSPDFLQEIVPVDAMSVNLHGLSVSSSYGDLGRVADVAGVNADALIGARKTAFNGQIEQCKNTITGLQDTTFPSAATALEGQFEHAVDSALNRAKVGALAAGYGDCMQHAGYNVASRDDLLALIDAQYQAQIAPDGTKGTGWAGVVASEHRAAEADARCRYDAYVAAMAAIAPALSDFATAHVDDLRSVDAAWVKVRSSALQLAQASPWAGFSAVALTAAS